MDETQPPKVPAISQKLDLLTKRWFTANPDDLEPEPYSLTPEEEQAAVAYQVERKKKWLAWKMAGMNYSAEQILLKISSVDWLDEINREETLATANANKNRHLLEISQRKKEQDEKQLAREERVKKNDELKARWTARFFYNVLLWTAKTLYGKELILNENTTPLVTTICYFLSGDPRFETELNFSFSKGLWLQGQPGLGKTFLLKCLKDNELSPIRIFSMVAVAKKVKSQGLFELEVRDHEIIYLDDVGTEEHIINHYGTKINFFKEFIELYYVDHAVYKKFIVSTNENFLSIEDKYGFRVRSRVKEMFNVVTVTGKDMRDS